MTQGIALVDKLRHLYASLRRDIVALSLFFLSSPTQEIQYSSSRVLEVCSQRE